MAEDKTLIEKLMEMFFKQPKVTKSFKVTNRISFSFYDNNALSYELDGNTIHKFYSKASVKDGRVIDSREAKVKSATVVDNSLIVVYEDNKLELKLELVAFDNCFIATGILTDKKELTCTNYIVPLDFIYPDKACNPLFVSLEQKMLLVPYDNDMWVSYEVTPLRPGRTSYDVTAIFDDITNNGLVIGALDFDTWKNAIRCSDHDARVYYAFSGVADACTHDIKPHGYVSNKSVKSSRFLVGWFDNVMDGLEIYGKKVAEDKYHLPWNKANPFGWNSYSAGCMSLEQWQEAGKFIKNEIPNFKNSDGQTYINLDANFMLNKKQMKKIVDELHANNQMAGNYLSPLLGLEGMDLLMPIKGSFGKTFKDIIMKDENGKLYPKIDSGRPVDITNPIAEKNLRILLQDMVEMGFDYIKIDFVSHGGVEGTRYNKDITTGRQALHYFYNILKEELDPAKIGREIFVDFSISPLFPGGFAQARRSCCDAFGKHEDVKYVLNSLNYAWWTNGTIYKYNDPDHTTLSCSMVDGRGFTEDLEAKSRYNASVISGTVLLLSDNFGPGENELIEKARARAIKFANNEKLNEVARIGKAFRPIYLKQTTCNIYYLNHNDKNYVAMFNFDKDKQIISCKTNQVGIKDNGKAYSLNDEKVYDYTNKLEIELEGFDSVILEIK